MTFNVDDLVAKYTVPTEDYVVKLPGMEVPFRRIRSAAELADIRDAAKDWAKDARALAQGDARQALGELSGENGRECIVRACMMAAAVIDETRDELAKRHAFCILAARSAGVFEVLWNGFVGSQISDAAIQVADADSGKGDCGLTTPCDSDCECAETPGESTPTN
jgi:hypothetical protein